MKILQIFGIVAAVHIGLFLVLFAVPGCRSSGKSAATTPPAAVSEPAPTVSFQPSSEPLTPTLLDDSALNPALAPATAPAVSTTARYAPTRPQSSSPSLLPAPANVKPASTYTVVKNDSLWSIAKRYGITVADLAAANNLSDKAIVRIGQVLLVPGTSGEFPASAATASVPARTAAANAPAATGASYTVVSGDTLSGIAHKQGTTVVALRKTNNLTSDFLRIGQILTIPSAAAGATAAAGAAAPAGSAAANAAYTHTVLPGETLSGIAHKYNVSVKDIAAANKISDPAKLRAGQALRIPGWQAPKETTAPTAKSTPAPLPAESAKPAAPAPTLVPAPAEQTGALVPVPVEPDNATATSGGTSDSQDFLPVVPVEESDTAPIIR